MDHQSDTSDNLSNTLLCGGNDKVVPRFVMPKQEDPEDLEMVHYLIVRR